MEYKYKDTVIFYQFYGKGSKLLVFLHGWGSNINLMLPIAKKFDRNSDDFSYLLIDFPPFGESQEPQKAWSLVDYSQSTYEIINHIVDLHSIDNIVLFGHSFGGRVAIKLASEYSFETQLSLVLLSSAGIKPRFSLKVWLKVRYNKIYKKLTGKNSDKFASNDYKLLSPTMKETFKNIIREDLSKNCKMITYKTLIVGASKDKETPQYMAKKIHKLIHNSRLFIIKDGDHFAYIKKLNNIFPIIYSFVMLE